jgi:uncharacterized protein with ATP-grasp and redox domains
MNGPLPLPLMTSEAGSFARHTIVVRKPQIIRQVIEDNDYAEGIVDTLEAFREEIAGREIQPLTKSAPDAAFWNGEAAAYRGRTWLELPWYFAETYFYRRLLEAVRYFQPGPGQGRDPFAVQKRRQAQEAVAWLAGTWGALDEVEPEVRFEALLHSCLWGNRADLSNLRVREQAQGGMATRQEQHNIVVNHTEAVAEHLSAGVDRVDFVNDNVGRELLFDLALADFLLSDGWARRVVLHLKAHPFFVSDAMPQDVQESVALLGNKRLGRRLDEFLATGRLVLKADGFWTRCLMFRQMPQALRADLAQADLVILKGDVNYRRLLDDLHWPPTARLEEIAAYFPVPFVALRTLKGEIMVGLEPGQAEALAAEDAEWLINGKRGVVHFCLAGG